MKSNRLKIIAISILAAGMPAGAVTNMPIAKTPVDVMLNTVNTLFVVDDSGSMDWEILVNSPNNSVLQKVSDSFFSIDKKTNKKIFSYEDSSLNLYTYLFPSVKQADGRVYALPNTNNNQQHFPALPPTAEFAFLRNSFFNKTFYNPKITYKPWAPVYINGKLNIFPNANPKAARSHPYLDKNGNADIECTSSTTCLLIDLTKDFSLNKDDAHIFNLPTSAPIIIPTSVPDPATGTTKTVQILESGKWKDIEKETLPGKFSFPFYPATYWVNDATCTADTYPSINWLTCAQSYDGTQMRRYDIINSPIFSGNSFNLPDGTLINRNREEELQNFANWFTYYRKRNLLLAGGVGHALEGVQSKYSRMFAGTVLFKSLTGKSSIYDYTNEDNTKNGRSLLNKLYGMQVNQGTPTREALNYAACQMNQGGGDRSECSSSVKSKFNYDNPFVNEYITEEKMRCSANSAFVLTDGYANDVDSSNNLYKQAKAFYDSLYSWNKDSGKTLNTYAITLGALGTIFTGNNTIPSNYEDLKDENNKITYTAEQNYAMNGVWPVPEDNSQKAIDDLWRATLYSKGKLLTATDSNTLDSSMSDIITSMFRSGAQTTVGVSNANITNDDRSIVYANYNSGDWTGELKSYNINLTTKTVEETPAWSAKELLNDKTSDNRIIATWNNGGKPFRSNNLDLSLFNLTTNSDGSDVVAFIRGDRSKEGTSYRKRNYLLGDIVNSSPNIVWKAKADYSGSYQSFKTTLENRTKTVYVGANDGMLHAFDATTGVEKWSYVPGFLHSKLKSLARPSYSHEFYVNGYITTWDVQFSDGKWHTILIGGLREGGKGYYAIDVTNPDFANETELASKVLWEYQTEGLSYGRPYIAQQANGKWVVLLTSGYNTTTGAGRLHVVDIETGTNLDTGNKLVIPVPASGEPYDQVGLAQVSALGKSGSTLNAEIKWVYAGDLNGNVWRFDISNSNASSWSYKKLADSLRAQGSTGQPITTAPEIGYIDTSANNCTKSSGSSSCQYAIPNYQNAADIKDERLMIYVGTGLLLDSSDLSKTETDNGFFAFEDADDSLVINEGVCANLNCLVQVGLGQAASSLGFNNWGTSSNSTEGSGVMDWWNVQRKSFNWDGNGDGITEQRSGRGWFFKFSETGGERLVVDPHYINGVLVFDTVTKSDNRFSNLGSCEVLFGARYIVGADRGGKVDGYLSRENLGFGFAWEPAAFSINGNTVGIDKGGIFELPDSPASKGAKKKYGWRELSR